MPHSKILYSKLLLFGEHTLLIGGSALLLPLKNFYAQIDYMDKAKDAQAAELSNKNLKYFLGYLENLPVISSWLDLDAFQQDLGNGMYLWSNIPTGYGVGSSGALCAAIYQKYRIKFEFENEMVEYRQLQNLFASMESFFHGKSSGLDPLACYLSTPAIYREQITALKNAEINTENWYLVDTGKSRQTGEFVDIFRKLIADGNYLNALKEQYLPYLDSIIDCVIGKVACQKINGSLPQLMESFSKMQLHFFEDMIPPKVRTLWENGLENSNFYMKLLGGGGGGFFLCYTNQLPVAQIKVEENGYKIIHFET
jgi:mevalonate kinase